VFPNLAVAVSMAREVARSSLVTNTQKFRDADLLERAYTSCALQIYNSYQSGMSHTSKAAVAVTDRWPSATAQELVLPSAHLSQAHAICQGVVVS
jgi:hypothetical protein